MAIVRHEINLITKPLTSGSSNEKISINPRNFNGGCVWYFEVVGSVTSGTATVTLRTSSFQIIASIEITETTSTIKRVPFSFNVNSCDYDCYMNITNFEGNTNITCARVVIIQSTEVSGNLTNLLGADGNFVYDNNSDGVSDNWVISTSTTGCLTTGNIQYFYPNELNKGIRYNLNDHITGTEGHIYYGCLYSQATSSQFLSLYMNDDIDKLNYDVNEAGGQWQFQSVKHILNTSATAFYMEVINGNGAVFGSSAIKEAYCFDLTSDFGTGLEPSKQELDEYMQAVTSYFISTSAYSKNSSNKQEINIEIGNTETSTAVSPFPLNNPKYWTYTANNWSNPIAFFFEATIKSSSASTVYAQLQEDDGNWNNWTTVTSLSLSSATVSKVRSTEFEPEDGHHYRVALYASAGATCYLYNAKIVIVQENLGNLLDSNNVLYRTMGYVFGNATTKGIGQTIQLSSSKTIGKVRTHLKRVGYPTGLISCKIYEATGTYGMDAYPSGAVLATSNTINSFDISSVEYEYITFKFATASQYTLSSGITYCITFDFRGDDSNNLLISMDNTYHNHLGNMCQEISSGIWSGDVSLDTIFYLYDNEDTPILKFEEQYLLLNTIDSGTGLQDMITTWNPNEWDGGNNTYKYIHCANNSADSSKLYNITGASDLVTVTGANMQISTSITMPVSESELNINVLDSTGAVNSANIQCLISLYSIILSGVLDGNHIDLSWVEAF